MQHYLLSVLIFTPILAAFFALLIPSAQKNYFKWIALIASVVQSLILVVILVNTSSSVALQFLERVPWITLDLGSWGILKAEYCVALDGLNLPLVALSVLIMLVATVSAWKTERSVKGFFILLLILNGAIIGTFTALDFLLFYLFFEFMLLPMFFLIGIWGGPRREYASIKFFLYTLLGSILILIVMIALYTSVHDPSTPGHLVHSFNILNMQQAGNFISNTILDPNNPWMIGGMNARVWAFLLLFLGFAIKLPMVPLHTWLPDAHVEAPTSISVILAAILLKIGGYGLLRIAIPIFPDAAVHFAWYLGLFGLISILYAAFAATASKDLKRLIAYSSVSHMGFVLLGIASLTEEGVTGAIYQMFSHGIISAALFIIVGVVYDQTHDRTISNYSGIAARMPIYFAVVIIAFFASLGLPAFSGFIAEVLVFLGAFKSHSVNGLLPQVFAVLATGGLLLAAIYYLWTIQRMFFGPYVLKGHAKSAELADLNSLEKLQLYPLCGAMLLFGILPQLMLQYINPFSSAFVDSVLNAAKVLTLNP